MSVGDPWTLAHIQALFGDGLEALRTVVGARGRDDDAAHGAIAAVHPTTGLVQGPHTAVGWLALRDRLAHAPDWAHDALLAAAHPCALKSLSSPSPYVSVWSRKP